jgi:hypothetical protein
VIASPVVLCLPQYLSMSSSVIPCSGLYSFFLVQYSTASSPGRRIPLTVALGVPSRGHSVKQFIFLAVTQTSLPLLREQMFTQPLTGNGCLFLTLGLSRKRLNNRLPSN